MLCEFIPRCEAKKITNNVPVLLIHISEFFPIRLFFHCFFFRYKSFSKSVFFMLKLSWFSIVILNYLVLIFSIILVLFSFNILFIFKILCLYHFFFFLIIEIHNITTYISRQNIISKKSSKW